VPGLIGRRATIDGLRRGAPWLVVVGLVNVAIPFWLLSWGETRIDSGLAAIIQAVWCRSSTQSSHSASSGTCG
jgi:drug/metabolite transporter (DMT)-like permease